MPFFSFYLIVSLEAPTEKQYQPDKPRTVCYVSSESEWSGMKEVVRLGVIGFLICVLD